MRIKSILGFDQLAIREARLSNGCIFNSLQLLKMPGPAALRNPAALAGPGPAILASP